MFTVRVRTMIGLAVLAVTLALGGTAQAMTLAVGSPDLAARIAVTVPVTVTCNPVGSLTVFSQMITVRVEQAAGRAIARGTGTLFAAFPSPLLFPCDGSTQELSVIVLADPAGPPFHGGKAIVIANGSSEAGTPSPFGSGFVAPFDRQDVSVAAVQVKLG